MNAYVCCDAVADPEGEGVISARHLDSARPRLSLHPCYTSSYKSTARRKASVSAPGCGVAKVHIHSEAEMIAEYFSSFHMYRWEKKQTKKTLPKFLSDSALGNLLHQVYIQSIYTPPLHFVMLPNYCPASICTTHTVHDVLYQAQVSMAMITECKCYFKVILCLITFMVRNKSPLYL